MDRRALIKNAGIAGVLAAGIAPAVHAQAAIRWRLASSFPKSLDTLYGGAEVFAKAVRAMSGGKFEISTHAAGELMPAFGVVDGVQQGSIEMAQTAPYYFFGKDETFALGCAIPFGLNSRQMTAWMYEGNGLKLMREFYAKYNIINFPAGNTGAQMGGWFRKEIKSTQDLKGLKFRIGGFARQDHRAHGRRTAEPAGRRNLYRRWKRARSTRPSGWGRMTTRSWASTRSRRSTTTPAGGKAAPQLDLFINQKAWDALSAENKAIVEAASAQAHVDIQAKYDARNPVALKQLVGAGAKLRPFPQDMMNEAFKHAMTIYDETSAKNEGFRKIYADLSKFRADQNLWFRFTEATFDRFMQAQKL